MMFRMLAGLVMAALWTISSASAQQPVASSRLDDIIKRGTLRVGMTGDYLPFTYFDKATAKFRGFDVDMAEALGKALGVKVEFVQTAWPQMMKDFEADNFDVAMGGVSITLDRQKKGMFSTPIMREGKTPIARCADKGKFETTAEIDKAGTRVIVNPGGTNERFAKANIKNAEIKTWNDNVTIFDAGCNAMSRSRHLSISGCISPPRTAATGKSTAPGSIDPQTERFRAKWTPVRVKKTRQNKSMEPGSDSIRTDKALERVFAEN